MSLLIWLPLHGNLNNYGSLPITFSLVTTGGGVAAASSGGKTSANCYQRTTVNTVSHITSSSTINLNGDFTMACWCYPTTPGAQTSANGIITNHDHSYNSAKGSGSGITLRYDDADATKCYISCNTATSSGRTYRSYYGTTNIYGAWHHLCLTFKKASKTYRLYVDGICENEFTCDNVAQPNKFNIFDWSTGHSSNGSYRPLCKINDVRVYDHCLSKKEVKLLSQGLVAHYKLDAGGNNNLLKTSWNFASTGGNGTVSLSQDGWYQKSYNHPAGSSSYNDFCSWGSAVTVNANETYTVSFLARSSNSTGNLVVYFYNNNTGVQVSNITSSQGHNKGGSDGNCQLSLTPEWKRYWITWKFNGTTTPLAKTLLFRILAAGGQVDIAQVKLEKSDTATNYSLAMSETNLSIADDSSGYGNHGTAFGSWALDSNSPRYNCCTIFNGSDTKIELSIKALMQSLLKDKCTINFWVNETNTGSRSIYFGGYSGSNFNIEMISGKIRVYWNGSPNIQTSSIVNGVWAMFTIVIDVKTGIKIYKDGVSVYTHSGALTDITANFTNNIFRIGSDSRTDDTMAECKMSDFRIYCSTLSEEDIKTLYNSAGSVTKDGGLIVYDLNEQIQSSAKIGKNGIFSANGFSERGKLANMKFTTLADGSAWARIFYHANHAGTVFFTSLAETLNSDTSDKFSCLYLLDELKATDGKYEFMLTYPEKHPGQYNRWKQTNNPCNENVPNGDGTAYAAGYTAVHIDWTSNYWGGLTRQNASTTAYTPCYLSGSVGHGNWFYAIGATQKHDGGIPGPSSGVQETELWVRVDTLPNNSKFNIMKEQFVSSALFQEI